MLDADLAQLYGVATKNLNLAVTRNRDRFPDDFMFRLNAQGFAHSRLQIETSKSRGGRRYLPYAFTQEGIAMLFSVPQEGGDGVKLNMVLLIFNGLQHFSRVCSGRAGFWQLPFLSARNRE